MRSAIVVGLLALALLGGCDKPQLSFKQANQVREIGHSTADVFLNPEAIGDAEGRRRWWHKLHEAGCTLRGHDIRLPGRFDVDDGLHEFQWHTVDDGVVAGPTHFDFE